MNAITRLAWDRDREYEVGLDRGVFYPQVGSGEPWNGLTSVTGATTGEKAKIEYIDGVKRNHPRLSGHFSGVIEAYSYPDSFQDNVLLQRVVQRFGMSYRTGTIEKAKIHLVYNILVSPSPFVRKQDVETFRWNFTTLPVSVPGGTRAAHLIVDTSVAYSWTIAELEDVLYGTDETPPRLPLPEEVFQIFEENSILQIIDNGDGTWTAIGPDDVIVMLDSTTFEITWPSAVYIDAESYTIHSL